MAVFLRPFGPASSRQGLPVRSARPSMPRLVSAGTSGLIFLVPWRIAALDRRLQLGARKMSGERVPILPAGCISLPVFALSQFASGCGDALVTVAFSHGIADRPRPRGVIRAPLRFRVASDSGRVFGIWAAHRGGWVARRILIFAMLVLLPASLRYLDPRRYDNNGQRRRPRRLETVRSPFHSPFWPTLCLRQTFGVFIGTLRYGGLPVWASSDRPAAYLVKVRRWQQ